MKRWVGRALVLPLSFGSLPGGPVAQPYDTYSYAYPARTFNGLYENADRDSTNNTGDPTLLRMEWSDHLNLADWKSSQLGAWVTNFFAGSDPVKWRTGVRTYTKVNAFIPLRDAT
jgi:hypothetical protein